ncbi:MAG: bis(5'-nucleosyl)-tetraphosphatase (symmetrical) YqeK, partial [Deinococcota bacterium]
MGKPLDNYIGHFKASGKLENDVKTLLLQHNHDHTYHHVKAVVEKAIELAHQFHGNVAKSATAAWLHDISAIIPHYERVDVAKALGLTVLPEEERFPMIIHQKLSVPISKQVFSVNDPAVLSAIECHTTLKAHASLTDKIVFVADKIAWDQAGTPPYINELQRGLEHSIDAAALAYLNYLWSLRDQLRVVHPWVMQSMINVKS